MTRTGPVSGREYTSGRERGFAEWRPHKTTREVMAQVDELLSIYARSLPMTVRQVFYRLVAAYEYPKTEAAYTKVAEYLNRAVRCGMVPFEAIRDDGTMARREVGYEDPDDFLDTLTRAYRRHRWQGQAKRLEVWVEAAGMVPQVERVAFPFGAEVYSSGGFESLTAKYHAAYRISTRDGPTVVLFVADYDASGLARMDAAAEDVTAMCDAWRRPRWEHVAVTAEQVELYGLPAHPGKDTDRAGGGMQVTVQAEALAPDDLAVEVRDALERHVNTDQLARLEERSDTERDRLADRLTDIHEGFDQ